MVEAGKKTERLVVLISVEEKARIDDWRREQPDLPSLGEAVRRLIRAGLQTPA
jgi:hypothetical protein